MDLKTFTDEELNAELRRRREQEQAEQMPKPQPFEAINIGPLKSVCVAYINEISLGLQGEDIDNEDIFEAAIEAVFGPKVWDWINAHN